MTATRAPGSRASTAPPLWARGATREGWRALRVAAAVGCGRVRSLRLVAPDGEPLASFVPGSHIVLEAGGATNAYSLTGEFLEPDAYEISVLRVADGHGGSRWIHDELEVGRELAVSAPRSAFPPVASARHHVFVAGGIGITPILSHVRAARRYGRSFQVVYAHRPDAPIAHLGELTSLCGASRLTLAHHRGELAAVLEDRLAGQPLGSMLLHCGPEAMMELVRRIAAELGWPPERIHSERFSAPSLDPGNPFAVTLARSHRQLSVASGVSLLEALEAAGIGVSNLCRQGVCGECRVGVRAGRPEHRDLFLTDEERAAGDSLMCCVSRAHGERLELDL